MQDSRWRGGTLPGRSPTSSAWESSVLDKSTKAVYIPERQKSSPTNLAVGVYYLCGIAWLTSKFFPSPTCTSSKHMVRMGNLLSCFWTNSSATVEMVANTTLGSEPLATSPMLPAGVSSSERKGSPQSWHTLRDNLKPWTYLTPLYCRCNVGT